MRAVIQRVCSGRVLVGNNPISGIGKGLVVLLGVSFEDSEEDAVYLANKIVNLRIFENKEEKMDLSLLDTKGELLVVSQFTLYGDCRKGRRPNYSKAANFEKAEELYEIFLQYCEEFGISVKTGRFRAKMAVEIINDGPVTILLDSKKEF